MRLSRTLLATAASALLACASLAATTGSAEAAPSWAPADKAVIHPGTMMYTDGAQCTANFVYTDSVPLGTKVTFTNDGNLASEGTAVGHGTLAYSSWITEHNLGTSDASTCAYNDLALVKVDAADVSKVNPSVPFWGGPTGIDTDGTKAGDRVWTFGNSSLRAGLTPLSPHTGISLGDDAADGGWTHPLYTVTPGVPGDSGSAFISADGKAIGTLSTLGLAPLPLSNNIGDLGKELAFAQAHSGIAGLQLVNGTEPFDPVL